MEVSNPHSSEIELLLQFFSDGSADTLVSAALSAVRIIENARPLLVEFAKEKNRLLIAKEVSGLKNDDVIVENEGLKPQSVGSWLHLSKDRRRRTMRATMTEDSPIYSVPMVVLNENLYGALTPAAVDSIEVAPKLEIAVNEDSTVSSLIYSPCITIKESSRENSRRDNSRLMAITPSEEALDNLPLQRSNSFSKLVKNQPKKSKSDKLSRLTDIDISVNKTGKIPVTVVDMKKMQFVNEVEDESGSESENEDDEADAYLEMSKMTVHNSLVILENSGSIFDKLISIRFDPDGLFKKRWGLVIILLVIYFSIITPFRVAFEESIDYQSSPFIYVMEIFFNCIFGIDIIVSFLTGYQYASGSVEYGFRKIAIKYLKSWFAIDFASVFPFEDVLSKITSSSLLLIPRLLRMFRLVALFRLLRLIKIDVYFSNSAGKKFISTVFYKLMRLVLLFLIILHVLACAWLFLGRIEYPDRNWITTFGIFDDTNSTQYITSIYYIMTCLSTTGFGDIKAITDTEMVFTTILLGVSSAAFGYFLGSITSIISSGSLMESLFRQKLQSIIAFMKYRNISKELASRVVNYYEYSFNQRKIYPFNDDALLDDLSSSLKLEMSMQINHMLIDRVPFFHGRDPAFIRLIITLLKPVIFAPGDFVCVEGDMGKAMYFVKKGFLDVLSGDLKTEYAKLKSGSFFGEIAMILSDKYTASVRALTNCDLYMLLKEDLNNLLKLYPEIAAYMKSYTESALYKFASDDYMEKLSVPWNKLSSFVKDFEEDENIKMAKHAGKAAGMMRLLSAATSMKQQKRKGSSAVSDSFIFASGLDSVTTPKSNKLVDNSILSKSGKSFEKIIRSQTLASSPTSCNKTFSFNDDSVPSTNFFQESEFSIEVEKDT